MEQIRIALCGENQKNLRLLEKDLMRHVNGEYKKDLHIDLYNRSQDLNLLADRYDAICFTDRLIHAFALIEKKEIVLPLRKEIKTYYIDDIYYIEADMKQIHIWTADTETVEQFAFHEIRDLLKDEDFLQIHRSYLVNSKHIKSIDNCSVHMKNGISLPISKYRKAAVYEQWRIYLNSK